jgi:hypothetical protein
MQTKKRSAMKVCNKKHFVFIVLLIYCFYSILFSIAVIVNRKKRVGSSSSKQQIRVIFHNFFIDNYSFALFSLTKTKIRSIGRIYSEPKKVFSSQVTSYF